MEINSHLPWFCIAILGDWMKQLARVFRKLRRKTKIRTTFLTIEQSPSQSRFSRCFFLIAMNCIFSVGCDWRQSIGNCPISTQIQSQIRGANHLFFQVKSSLSFSLRTTISYFHLWSYTFWLFIYVHGFIKHAQNIHKKRFCYTRVCSRYFSVVLASESSQVAASGAFSPFC